ncbi:SpoIIE family protein phosphatase [Puerhibacterium puerhi]|uniref:SpoIIE family protein phosphatase n=1 Tax=Puerhibacterium puerhi TaxID=2692623 RepID=UPI00135B0C2C|nr:SpoIIE family protein phosphatase [Puerhibacterium puerhi]
MVKDGTQLPTRVPRDVGALSTQTALQAARIGTFEWDLRTGILHWDRRLLEMFGYDDGTFDYTIEGFNRRLHPDDLPRVTEALQHARDTCGEYFAEFRVQLPDGTARWVAARGHAVAGADGTATRLIGAAYDTTATQDGEARVERVLEAMPSAFFFLDRQWRFTYVNAEAERVLSNPRSRLLGGVVWDLFPAAIGLDFERYYRHSMDTGEPVRFEEYYPAPLDRWYEVRAWPSPDGLSVYFLEITARKEAQDRLARAAAQAQLAARVSAELSETLDVEQVVARLTQLVVPALADWCVVSLVEDDDGAVGGRRQHDAASWPVDGRRVRDAGAWHVDPQARPLAERYAQVRLSQLKDDSFLRRALTGRRAVEIEGPATPAVQAVLQPGEARDLIARLAPASGAALPLRARGRTVGALSLFRGAGRAPLTAEEVATAEDVAGRAALALDNAHLYRDQRHVAEGFQRSLLTPPVQPDHVQIAVRYHPAAHAAQVGGDWYDAFMQPDGGTVVVIGDVVGHDLAAAVTMSHVRSALRSIAVTTGAGPAEVLQRVDQALRTLQADAVATAVVARIEQTEDEERRGVTRVRWSSAGHPPPMLVTADGEVSPLTDGRPDPLLGIMPDAPRTEAVVEIARGATVVFYTDGLVERRDQHLRDGIERLRTTLDDLAGLGLDDLCDEVVARLLPERPSDDVALVAIRLHPQDRPRPAEAGPGSVPDAVARLEVTERRA